MSHSMLNWRFGIKPFHSFFFTNHNQAGSHLAGFASNMAVRAAAREAKVGMQGPPEEAAPRIEEAADAAAPAPPAAAATLDALPVWCTG